MSTEEQPGSHLASAAPRNEGNFTVNTKTLVMAAILLLGGTVGGGSITLANKVAPTTAPEVTAALADMNQKLVGIAVTLAEMKTQLIGIGRENDRRDSFIADHEGRLRTIEQTRLR